MAVHPLDAVVSPVAVKRRPGRPPKSLGATTNATLRITISDFAFLRAVIQGVEAHKAAERYMLSFDRIDARTAQAHERRLRKRLNASLGTLIDRELALKYAAELDAIDVDDFPAPTLADYITKHGLEDWSEADALEQWEDEFGGGAAHQVNRSRGIVNKLHALTWLQDRVAVVPDRNAPVEHWLDQSIAAALRIHGVLTLGNLVDWINLTGRRWYEKVSGLGRERSHRLLMWLVQHEDYLRVRLSDRVRAGVDVTRLDADALGGNLVVLHPPATVKIFGIVPLDDLAWPVALLGQDGEFRSDRSNTLGASNDVEAIHAWYTKLKTKSLATQDAYRRAIERLMLWALLERATALSSLNSLDMIAFREFLASPPLHWCHRFPVMRGSKDWRPFRGPLTEVSVQATMSAVATLFADLLESGYLRANAMAGVRSVGKSSRRMDVMRSFCDEDLAAMRATLEGIADGPSKRRLRALILLLQTTGLRRSEAVSLKWGDLSLLRVDNRLSNTWGATVLGKGNKERVIPIKQGTINALEAHYQDRVALVEAGKLPASYAAIPKEKAFLLGVLDAALSAPRKMGAGFAPSDASRDGNADGALSVGALHGMLVRFFAKVAQRPDLQVGQTDFLKASAHWLRHTFAHQALKASGNDLPAIQQILGHADIATVGIYVKADMSARVAAVEGVVEAV